MLIRNSLATRKKEGFGNLTRGIDRFFGDFEPFGTLSQTEAAFTPSVDIEEDEKSYHLRFDLPGIKKEDVKIEVDENRLIVSGERKTERSEEKEGRRYSERAFGRFERAFSLPSNLTEEQVEARYQDGVLEVVLSKPEEKKPRRITIG